MWFIFEEGAGPSVGLHRCAYVCDCLEYIWTNKKKSLCRGKSSLWPFQWWWVETDSWESITGKFQVQVKLHAYQLNSWHVSWTMKELVWFIRILRQSHSTKTKCAGLSTKPCTMWFLLGRELFLHIFLKGLTNFLVHVAWGIGVWN